SRPLRRPMPAISWSGSTAWTVRSGTEDGYPGGWSRTSGPNSTPPGPSTASWWRAVNRRSWATSYGCRQFRAQHLAATNVLHFILGDRPAGSVRSTRRLDNAIKGSRLPPDEGARLPLIPWFFLN